MYFLMKTPTAKHNARSGNRAGVVFVAANVGRKRWLSRR